GGPERLRSAVRTPLPPITSRWGGAPRVWGAPHGRIRREGHRDRRRPASDAAAPAVRPTATAGAGPGADRPTGPAGAPAGAVRPTGCPAGAAAPAGGSRGRCPAGIRPAVRRPGAG